MTSLRKRTSVAAPGATSSSPVPAARVAFSRRHKPVRSVQWSWLHATACSCAIVASGAYMHSAIQTHIDTLAADGAVATTAPSPDGLPVPSATQPLLIPARPWIVDLLNVSSYIVLPWRSLVVLVCMALWGLSLLLSRKLDLQQPLKRVLRRLHASIHTLRTKMVRILSRHRNLSHHQNDKQRSRRHSTSSSSGRRQLLSGTSSLDWEIDEDDLLVVTSLSVERKHALPGRARRTSQTQSPSQSLPSSLSPPASTVSSTSSLESIETVDVDHDDESPDAQIVLHPHDGAKGGRHQSNQIIVDDPYVSRYHFEIGYDPLEKEYFLQDLGSTTGTYLYLKPDVPKRLNVDDRVRLGDTEFEVVAIDDHPSTGTPFLRICFTEGPLRGVSQTIGKTSVTLGRRSCNALCITDDASISGRHSNISFLGDGFYVTDLGSTNGSALRLSASGERSSKKFLLHGDVFGVGANRFLVEYTHELQIQATRREEMEYDLAREQLRRAAAH